MTFLRRYIFHKRKHDYGRRPNFRQRRRFVEPVEHPWRQTFRLDHNLEEEDTHNSNSNSNSNNKVSERAEKQEHEDPCLLLELPTSILADILSRHSFEVVCTCRCVSKDLGSVIRSPDFNSLRLERADSEIFLRSDSVIHPCRALHFVDLHGISDSVPSSGVLRGPDMDVNFRVFLPKGRLGINMMIEKRNYDIVNSCNGLICLRKASMFGSCKSPCIISNPLTGEFTFIPKPEKKGTIQNWTIVSGFGCSARSNVYKVVRLFYGASALNLFERIAEVYSLGGDSWRTIGPAPLDTIHEGSAVFLNGVIHWLSEGDDSVRKYSVLCFDFEDEKFHELRLPSQFLENIDDDPRKSKLNLGALRRCLCVSGVVHLTRFDIWVMRDYRNHESWTKEFSFHIFLGSICRPIKWLENEDLVMLLNKMALVFYNPVSKTVRAYKVSSAGSVTFQAIAHIPNFGSLKDIAGAYNLVVHNDNSRLNEQGQMEDAEAISVVEDEDRGMSWAFSLWY